MKLAFLGYLSLLDEDTLRRYCNVVVKWWSRNEVDLPIEVKFYDLYSEFCYVASSILEEELRKQGISTKYLKYNGIIYKKGLYKQELFRASLCIDDNILNKMPTAERNVVLDIALFIYRATRYDCNSQHKHIVSCLDNRSNMFRLIKCLTENVFQGMLLDITDFKVKCLLEKGIKHE